MLMTLHWTGVGARLTLRVPVLGVALCFRFLNIIIKEMPSYVSNSANTHPVRVWQLEMRTSKDIAGDGDCTVLTTESSSRLSKQRADDFFLLPSDCHYQTCSSFSSKALLLFYMSMISP